MQTITYTLRNGKSSDFFYQELKSFAETVSIQLKSQLGDIADDGIEFILLHQLESLRTKEEYLADLLMMGVLWKEHIGKALKSPHIITSFLEYLVAVRKGYVHLKPPIDKTRGILETLFLLEERKEGFRNFLDIHSFIKLTNWLAASGDFKQEVLRFRLWQKYFASKNTEYFRNTMLSIFSTSLWFEKVASERLGVFTTNVPHFLETAPEKYKWKEDIIFCCRRPVEYHLNMVVAEIMNKAYRIDFLNCSTKAVMVPTCMREKSASECKAMKNEYDAECIGCSIECNINHIRAMGKEHSFLVYLIPHSSSYSKWLEKRAAGKDVGLIGITCVLNLITGGMEAKLLNVPVQCVLLDYCGCTNHWHKTGIPTAINYEELKRLLLIELTITS